MKRVILTVGPQFSGKSTFCQKVISTHPEVVLVSRDAILIELFGTAWVDPYTGGHEIAWDKIWEIITQHLQKDNVTIILDAWNGTARHRQEIITKLRSLQAETVGGWCFITPEDICLQWYLQDYPPERGGKASKMEKLLREEHTDSYLAHHRAFHSQPVDLNQGFDFIRQINPLNGLPPDLSHLQG